MRALLGVTAAAVVLSGCASEQVTRQDLDLLKDQLRANQQEETAKLRQELTGVDAKYVLVQQVEQRVIKQLEEMARLQKELTALAQEMKSDVKLANTNVLKVLEFEERLMTERLATLRDLIAQLKK